MIMAVSKAFDSLNHELLYAKLKAYNLQKQPSRGVLKR